MVRKAVRPYSVVLKEFEELDVKDAQLRAFYEPMSKEEVAALKLGRGSSLIRSKHRHADILHWEDDISTIATVDAPPGERALLATSMRTRSAGGRRGSTGGSYSTAAATAGSGRRAWSAHAGRRARQEFPEGDSKTAEPPHASSANAVGPPGGAPDMSLLSPGVGRTGASAALQTNLAYAGTVAVPGSSGDGQEGAVGVGTEGGPDGVTPTAAAAPTATEEAGKKLGRPTSARPLSGSARDAAQESIAGLLGNGGGSHDDPVQGPPLSHALRAALQGAARSMTRPMSAQPPSSQPRSKLIEQYIEAQRIRPQSATPPGTGPAKGAQCSSPGHVCADQADQGPGDCTSPEGDEGHDPPPSPQRRLIRFMSEVTGGGSEQDSLPQRQQGGDQPTHVEGATRGGGAEAVSGRGALSGGGGVGFGRSAVVSGSDKAPALQGPGGAGPAGVRALSAPAARPAVFGRSTIMGGPGQARGASQEWGRVRCSSAGGSGAGGAGGGATGQSSLVALLGGTGGAGNVPQSLLQIAAEAEAEGVEDVDDAAGMDGEDAVMMQRHLEQGSKSSSWQCPISAGAASRMQLSADAQLQYFGHCGLGSSRRNSAGKYRPEQHAHHPTRRAHSALATSTTTTTRAAPTAATLPPHQRARPISGNVTARIPVTLTRRALSAPRTFRHPYGDAEFSSTGSAAGRDYESHPSAQPAFNRVRASSAPRAQRSVRPLSARQQELLQQHKEGTQGQQQQQRQRPQSASPIVESPPTSLSRGHLHRASSASSASKASSSWHLTSSSRWTGGLSTSPSMGRSHISTAGFPAHVHRGVGEGHDPRHIRMSSLDRPSNACTTYNPEKAAAVYGVRSAARRELIRGMAAAVMAGRHTAAGSHLNTVSGSSLQAPPPTGSALHSEHGGQKLGNGWDAGGEGVGVGVTVSNGVLARSPSGAPVATHKGVRQQQWLHQRMLHSSAPQQQLQQGRDRTPKGRSGALSNGKDEGMDKLRGGLQQGSAHGDGDCRLGRGIRKALGGWSSAGLSHSALGSDNVSNTYGGTRCSLGGIRPASAPLQSCHTAAAAGPPPLPPPAPSRPGAPVATGTAAGAGAVWPQEQQAAGRGIRPSSARPWSGNGRPQSGRPSSARDSCVVGSTGVGDGGGGGSGSGSGNGSARPLSGNGRPQSGRPSSAHDSCAAGSAGGGDGGGWHGGVANVASNCAGSGYGASLAKAHGAHDSAMKQADWEFQCERQELGIVDEDSGEGSDSDGL